MENNDESKEKVPKEFLELVKYISSHSRYDGKADAWIFNDLDDAENRIVPEIMTNQTLNEVTQISDVARLGEWKIVLTAINPIHEIIPYVKVFEDSIINLAEGAKSNKNPELKESLIFLMNMAIKPEQN